MDNNQSVPKSPKGLNKKYSYEEIGSIDLATPINPSDLNNINQIMKKIRSRFESVFPVYLDTGYKIREAMLLPDGKVTIFLCGISNVCKAITENDQVFTKNIPDVKLTKLAIDPSHGMLYCSSKYCIFELTIENLSVIRKIKIPYEDVKRIAYSIETELLYALSAESIVSIDLKESGENLLVSTKFEGDFSTFKFSQGDWLLGHTSGKIEMHNSNSEIFTTDLPGAPTLLKYARSSNKILVSVDKTIFMLTLKLKPVSKYQLQALPSQLVMTCDEKYIITANSDGKIGIIDTNTQQIIQIPVHHGEIVNFFVDDAISHITTCGHDSKIAKFIFPIKKTSRSLLCNVNNFVFYGDQPVIIYIENFNSIKMWNIHSFQPPDEIYKSDIELNKVLLYIQKQDFLVFSNGFEIIIMSMQTKQMRSIKGSRKVSLSNIASDEEGLYLSSISSENSYVIVFNLKTYEFINRFKGHEGKINCQVHLKGSSMFATGSNDKKIIVWNIKNPSKSYKLEGHSQPVTCITQTREGNKIISGSKDNTIKVWAWRDKQMLISLNSHTSLILNVIVDKSNHLTSISADGTMIYWNLRAYVKCFRTVMFVDPVIFCMSKNNRFMAFADLEQIRVLDSPMFSSELDVVGPVMEDKYVYMDYLLKVLRGDQVQYNPIWNDWAVLPYQFNTMYFYAFTNMYRHIKLSIQDSASLTPCYFTDPFSLVTYKKYQKALNVMFNSTKSLLQQNMHSLSFLNEDVLIKLNLQGHSQLHKFYESILNKCIVEDFPKFADVNSLPIILYSSTVNPVRENFFPQNSLVVTQKSKTKEFSPDYHTHLTANLSNEKSQKEGFSLTENLVNPHLNNSSFEQDNENDINTGEKVPIVVYVSSIRMNMTNGSKESVAFIESLLKCPNKEVFRTKFIQTILSDKWNQLKKYQVIQALCYLVFILAMCLYIIFLYENFIGLIVLIVVGGLLSVYDCYQMYKNFTLFWRDVWNYLDLCRIFFIILYALAYYFDNDQKEHCLILLMIISFSRGISFFRLFNDTRYIIQLLVNVIIDMKSFAILLTYSTVSFSMILMVQGKDKSFAKHLKDSYMVNLGEFHTDDFDGLSWVIFVLMSILNVIILLNMLILIMGETFSSVRENSEIADYIEIAEMLLEVETILAHENHDKKKYLQICEAETLINRTDQLTRDIKKIKRLLKQKHNPL